MYGQLQYFSSTTLSSFYLDVIKDTLYSNAESSPARRAIQTVLFHVLTVFNKAIAPLAPHFAEEVYDHYRECFTSEQPTVFRTGWLDFVPEEWNNDEVREEFLVVKQLRTEVNQLLEQARASKVIGPSLEGAVEIQVLLPSSSEEDKEESASSTGWSKVVETYAEDFAKLFITSEVKVTKHRQDDLQTSESDTGSGVFVKELKLLSEGEAGARGPRCRLVVKRASLFKCPRCWTFTAQATDSLCGRCGPVVASLEN